MENPSIPLKTANRVDDISVLAKNPLLARFGTAELGTFLESLDQVALAPGAILLGDADEGEYMYFLLEGEALAGRGQVETRTLRPSDHFGELSLVGAKGRESHVEAITVVRLARLSRARFLTLAADYPTTALHFLEAMVGELGEELGTMTASVGKLLRQRSLPRRTEVDVQLEGKRVRVGTGTPVGALLPDEVDGCAVVAALIDHKPVTLGTPLISDGHVAPVTTATSEGRAIYRASVGLLLLEAAARVAPTTEVRLGPMIGSGQLVIVGPEPVEDRVELAARLTRGMHAVARDAPAFREELWTVDEARTLFAERGWKDAAALLRTRRDATVTLVSCGSVYALRPGPLLPDARLIRGFVLTPHVDGLFLDFGAHVRLHWLRRPPSSAPPSIETASAPLTPARTPQKRLPRASTLEMEIASPRYGAEMTREQQKWLSTLGVTSVGTFNDLCVSGQVAQLIRISEGFHEKRIGQLADAISKRRQEIKIIAIAGPSSSGKTTFIKRLTIQLEINGLHPVSLSLDDYYVDREKTVRDANGDYDFEAFEALDVGLLQNQVAGLLRGERVRTARYDFVAGRSMPEGGPELLLRQGDVLMLEGIHALNPALLEREGLFKIFIHPATTLPFDRLICLSPDDTRLLRRIVRDRHSRNLSAAENITRWPAVRLGEKLHIYPFLEHADAVFDSSLVYEMSVLKVYADRYLLEVPEDHAAFSTAYRLRHLIDRFVTIYPDHVPSTSLLREFIGGSGFEQ